MKTRDPAAMPPIRRVRSSVAGIPLDAFAFDQKIAADLPPIVDRWRMAHLEDDRSFRGRILRSAGLMP